MAWKLACSCATLRVRGHKQLHEVLRRSVARAGFIDGVYFSTNLNKVPNGARTMLIATYHLLKAARTRDKPPEQLQHYHALALARELLHH